MPTVHVRGVDLNYEDHGSGPTLVVLHGLLASLAAAPVTGLGAADLAGQGLRVIAYDARGHGRSQHSTRHEDYRWSALAEDLRGLLDALGVERASLCGTSMGAGTSLMFALSYPKRVERLVLRSPPPFEPGMRPARVRLGALAVGYRCLGPSLTGRLLLPSPRSSEGKRMRALICDQRSAAILPAIRGLLFSGSSLPLERMHEIQQRALILAHAGDGLHPLRSGELLRERLPNAVLDVAPSSAHRRADPEALTRVVASFIKASPAAP